jgi:hypothetical protein
LDYGSGFRAQEGAKAEQAETVGARAEHLAARQGHQADSVIRVVSLHGYSVYVHEFVRREQNLAVFRPSLDAGV